MSLRNLQYQSSGRGADIMFFWRRLPKFFKSLSLLLVPVFVLLGLLQAQPSFSQTPPVVINEVMYDPVSSEGCDDSSSEWVELKNLNNATTVTLNGWFIKDATTTKRQFSAEIHPGGYLVLVANKICFLKNHSGIEDAIIVDLGAKIGSGLNNTDSDKDGVADRVILLDGAEIEKDNAAYAENAVAEGKSYAFDGTVWKEANPTPGAENSFPEEETKDQQEEQQPQLESQEAVTFSAPSSVAAGVEFSVSIKFSDFDLGIYAVKVLVGKNDSFIYGNTKGSSGWLTQNGRWSEMPQIRINSSGSKTIQAKTDDDTAAGNYLIAVNVAGKKSDGSFEPLWKISDLPTKSLTITGSAKPEGSVGTQDTSKSTGNESGGPSFAEATEDNNGEVKGAEAPQSDGFKLNFYIILGIFGLLVGSGGLMLAFRRKARQLQTPDTPESEPATPS